jgi:hypothetical protein
MELYFRKRYHEREDLDNEPRPFWYLYANGVLEKEFYVVQYRVDGPSFFAYPISNYEGRENFRFYKPEDAKRRLVEYYTELDKDVKLE